MTAPAYQWSKDEVQIIKAAWATDAGKLALQLIVERLCILHGSSYSTDTHEMAFHEGRRFVGRELAHAINTPMEKAVRKKHDDDLIDTKPISATERAARVASGQWERAGSRRKRAGQ